VKQRGGSDGPRFWAYLREREITHLPSGRLRWWLLPTTIMFLSGWLSDRLRVRKTVTAFGGVSAGACFLVSAMRR
jgi:hypothetical protein